MRYGSVCSGIEAATQAWHPLGWSPAFFSEIEAFPSAVLAHHYGSNLPGQPDASNGVPNHGDMTNFKEWPDHAIDLLVGGTPCQSFSVAGLRGGLDDARGNLMLTYGAIARRYRPRWLVWENVPGVLSSDGGRDFASLLGLLSGRRVEVPADGWRNAGVVEGYQGAYGLAWRVLDAQYVRVDGYDRAVPQRRRRVFVVGYLGDWRRAAAVLLEPEGMRGDSAPRREAGKSAAPTISSRPSGGGGLGTDFDLDGGLIASDVAPTMRAGGNKTGGDRPPGSDVDTLESLVAHPIAPAVTGNPYGDHESREGLLVAHTLKAEGFDASEDGTGRGTPIVPVFAPSTASTLTRGAESAGKGGYAGRRQEDESNLVAIPFDTTQITSAANYSNPKNGDPCHPLASGAHAPAIAYGLRGDASRSGEAKTPSLDAHGNLRLRDAGFNVYEEFAPTLDTAQTPTVATAWAVRRLTPTECARLQGFPDDHCRISWRGKPADQCPDGPQYKAYGNSMAVNAMRWIGRRIDIMEKIIQSGRTAA